MVLALIIRQPLPLIFVINIQLSRFFKGSQPLGVLGQTVDDRESRLIPLANVLDSLNDVDEVRLDSL